MAGILHFCIRDRLSLVIKSRIIRNINNRHFPIVCHARNSGLASRNSSAGLQSAMLEVTVNWNVFLPEGRDEQVISDQTIKDFSASGRYNQIQCHSSIICNFFLLNFHLASINKSGQTTRGHELSIVSKVPASS